MINQDSNIGKLILLGKKMSNILFKIEHEPIDFTKFQEAFKVRKEFDSLISKAFHQGEIESSEKFHNYKLDND